MQKLSKEQADYLCAQMLFSKREMPYPNPHVKSMIPYVLWNDLISLLIACTEEENAETNN